MTNPFRVALAGAGPHGRRRLRSLQAMKAVEIVAVADADEALAQSLGQQLGVPAFDFRTFPRMLEAGELDGLVVATAQDHQVRVAAFTLRRGIAVFCEKPVGGTVGDAPWLARQGGGLPVASGYELPFVVPDLHDLAKQNSIERVDAIAASAIGLPAYPRKPFWLSDGIAYGTDVPGGRGADALADLLSLILPLVKADPVGVTASAWNAAGEPIRALGHENRIKATVGFTGNVRAELLVAPEPYAGVEHGIRVRVSGDGREAELPTVAAHIDRQPALDAQIRNWVGACLGEEELRSRPEDTDRISRVMAAVYRSVMLDGREVEPPGPERAAT